MSKSLDDALANSAWSVSAVMFDLNDMLDDEGRPISERRADAMTRVGVEMEMRKCPFDDIRKDKWMNVSALAQITRYLNPVLEEMEAFRRQTKTDKATWDDILACVIDQLSGPAIYLLKQRDAQSLVPGQVAVGHKLAAGMFGVMRGLQERLVKGETLPVSVDTFMNLIVETEALVGATYEACAGSMPMIRKATTALVDGNPDNQLEIDPARIDIARGLALQVQLGIFWHLYDRLHLWSLLRGEFKEHLAPINAFLQRKLDTATNEQEPRAPQPPNSDMLPAALDPQARKQLEQALNEAADAEALHEDMRTASELLNEPGSPITYQGDIEPFARSVANYLHTYRTFETVLCGIEQQLRKQLGFSLDTPIRLGAAVLPTPQAMTWYELILGRRFGEDGHLTGKSTKVRSAVASD